jgi:hypothetical protein
MKILTSAEESAAVMTKPNRILLNFGTITNHSLTKQLRQETQELVNSSRPTHLFLLFLLQRRVDSEVGRPSVRQIAINMFIGEKLFSTLGLQRLIIGESIESMPVASAA